MSVLFSYRGIINIDVSDNLFEELHCSYMTSDLDRTSLDDMEYDLKARNAKRPTGCYVVFVSGRIAHNEYTSADGQECDQQTIIDSEIWREVELEDLTWLKCEEPGLSIDDLIATYSKEEQTQNNLF